MKAIIMAGGEGSRLRPLTCDCPKPMMRLMNRPLMQYALELLKRHGVTEIAATLGYLPDAILDFFTDGSDQGLTLKWTLEQTPMGTAGGVRLAKDFLDETFVVLSGDGITDLDLTQAVRFHRERGALATLVLRRETDPSEYGVVSADEDGRIRGFYEKPGRCDMLSDTINTGVYILEPEVLDRIPDDQPYDFGHDLFPRLVREGAPIYGFVTDGYWCDIGDVSAYLDAHRAALRGEIHLDGCFPRPNAVTVLPGAQVDETAVLEAPCLIAPGAQVLSGARIGADCVIGENCIVGERASLKRCVLWPGAQVGAGAQARGCVLGTNAFLGEDAQAFEASVLGSGATVGTRAVVAQGVRIWPEKSVLDGERLDANLVWGNRHCERFSAGTIALNSPAQAVRAAQSCAAVLRPRELLLGRSASAVSSALWHAAAAGAMAQGVQVLDAGVCTLPQLRHAQRALQTDAAALIEDRRLIPVNERGARLSARLQRSVNAMNARHDYAGPFSRLTRPIQPARFGDGAYIAEIAGCFDADPSDAPAAALHAQSPHLLSLAERAFLRAGLSVRTGWEEDMTELAPEEIGVWLDARGETAVIADESGALDDAQQQLMIAWIALEQGEKTLFLPVCATRTIETLAARYDAHVVDLPGEPSAWMNALAEQSPAQFALHFDGLRMAMCALSLLTQKGLTLSAWKSAMPSVHRRSRTIDVPVSETGRVLQGFAGSAPDMELGGGVRFSRADGWAWVCPDEQKPEFRIVTEAASAEFARELCDFCESTLKKLL